MSPINTSEGNLLKRNKAKEHEKKGKTIDKLKIFSNILSSPFYISIKLYKIIVTAIIKLCPTSNPLIPAKIFIEFVQNIANKHI